MSAVAAFLTFAARVLSSEKAACYGGLVNGAKGQRKLLDVLHHDFDRAIRPDARHGILNRKTNCYAFHSSVGFGAEFTSVDEAYDRLSLADGWLIIAADGSGGIYRPEARWDATVEIVG